MCVLHTCTLRHWTVCVSVRVCVWRTAYAQIAQISRINARAFSSQPRPNPFCVCACVWVSLLLSLFIGCALESIIQLSGTTWKRMPTVMRPANWLYLCVRDICCVCLRIVVIVAVLYLTPNRIIVCHSRSAALCRIDSPPPPDFRLCKTMRALYRTARFRVRHSIVCGDQFAGYLPHAKTNMIVLWHAKNSRTHIQFCSLIGCAASGQIDIWIT